LPRLFLGDEACGQQMIAQRTVHGFKEAGQKRQLPILAKAVVIGIAGARFRAPGGRARAWPRARP